MDRLRFWMETDEYQDVWWMTDGHIVLSYYMDWLELGQRVQDVVLTGDMFDDEWAYRG